MRMLIVLGSPRKNGNSEILAQHVAQGMEDGGGTVEYIRLSGLNLSPCQGCGGWLRRKRSSPTGGAA